MRHRIIDFNGFLKRVEANHIKNWNEKLLLEDFSFAVNLDDGWSYIISLHAIKNFTSNKYFTTLLFGFCNALFECFNLVSLMQRAY